MELAEALFRVLASLYSSDSYYIEGIWDEIRAAYSESHRRYHTLSHLSHMWQELVQVRGMISEIDALVLALLYHDIIYDVRRQDNEEGSNLLMQERASQLNIPAPIIEKASACILSTKKHKSSRDSDVEYFLDADLSILGAEPNLYRLYARSIRSEYNMYEDREYKKGRKALLEGLLKRKSIFRTSHFYERKEEQARQNIRDEIEYQKKGGQ